MGYGDVFAAMGYCFPGTALDPQEFSCSADGCSQVRSQAQKEDDYFHLGDVDAKCNLHDPGDRICPGFAWAWMVECAAIQCNGTAQFHTCGISS